MFLVTSKAVVALLFCSSFTLAAVEEENFKNPVCVQIGASISSSSDVYYPGHPLYIKGVSHWASSSSQVAKCVVEPGTATDIGIILGILGKNRTPFAVKGGGHATNPTYSSTTGVHISIYRFSKVLYNKGSQTADIGAGLIWDDVYAALEPYGVNVVGGRVSGVGVAGVILGGGYSWKTNQHGLIVDTVTAFELVKPDGKVVTVTKASDSRLFSGLKGIVTKFTMRTFPQTKVWGGMILVGTENIAKVTAATAAFSSKVTDPKAGLITAYNFGLASSPFQDFRNPQISLLLFYDGPNPPRGIFDAFMTIPSLLNDVSTKTFASLIKGFPTDSTLDNRSIFCSLSVLSLTPSFLNAVLNETNYWGAKLTPKSGAFISYATEPFLPSIYSHNKDSTAFPPVRSKGFLPVNIFYSWTNRAFDEEFYKAARASATALSNAAKAEGQSVLGLPVYPNYAMFDTPLENMYGSNLPTLRSLKSQVDPQNVMALAGGWKF
ncbi:hypothetical protein M413DRAFT_423817 [Hebeloma cylindrosporum]|uniref:FAD-binding PCMH-type domain-containing protein n=1 Tax=Hebeloma cylindrosporum TaxID=76867 RepID=A0A0C3BZY7_HEBCY|nr:hypothetical protein M413DRAFT_423817 [Hebeloma cylindrosporum h7]